MKKSAPRIFVLLVLFFGIIIHVLGSFKIQTGDASIFAHYAMFTADVVAFIGLSFRKHWGYWFSIALFLYAVCSQAYWTVEAIIKRYDMVVAQGATAFLCIIGLLFLIRRKKDFVLPKSSPV